MSARTKSITQNTGAFEFTNENFTDVYPKEKHTRTMAGDALQEFCDDVGIPEQLKVDRAPAFCGRNSDFLAATKKNRIQLTFTEPERVNQIWKVDQEIRELKKRWHHK